MGFKQVSENLQLEFTNTPFQLELASNMHMSNQKKKIINQGVSEMVGKGAVA